MAERKMVRKKTFAVVGGDLRQCCLANLLAADESVGRVFALCMDECTELSSDVVRSNEFEGVLPQCDVVVLPLPVSGGGELFKLLNAPFSPSPPPLSRCLQAISPFAVVFGGMVSDEIQRMAEKYGRFIHDYYRREELIVRNCIPTAEGALAIAMQETARTIFGSRCLIVGYGRVGKASARLFDACGAKVSVAARGQEALAWAGITGYESIPMGKIGDALPVSDIILNTASARLFDETLLRRMRPDSLLIDLSSKPGGVDFEAAKRLGRRVVWALSLPGKVAPVTAAEIVRDTVCHILAEQEDGFLQKETGKEGS